MLGSYLRAYNGSFHKIKIEVTRGMEFVGPLPKIKSGNQYPVTARSSLVAVKLVKVVIENHGLYVFKGTTQEYRDDQGKKPIDDIVIFRKEQVR
ncbi:hypothetical protein KEM48_003457 [Puccinia striiformis f. sp. tritici PST-130]|nr:hypothetical protein KEM48_003457 [Puccinia striiformis f. sp. tritici PST-130]